MNKYFLPSDEKIRDAMKTISIYDVSFLEQIINIDHRFFTEVLYAVCTSNQYKNISINNLSFINLTEYILSFDNLINTNKTFGKEILEYTLFSPNHIITMNDCYKNKTRVNEQNILVCYIEEDEPLNSELKYIVKNIALKYFELHPIDLLYFDLLDIAEYYNFSEGEIEHLAGIYSKKVLEVLNSYNGYISKFQKFLNIIFTHFGVILSVGLEETIRTRLKKYSQLEGRQFKDLKNIATYILFDDI